MIEEKTTTIIYAPRIHVGGGLVLLRELLASGVNRFVLISDPRADLDRMTNVEHSAIVRPGLSSYLLGEIVLHRIANRFPGADVLCLSSLPPLLRIKNRTFVFLQNRFVIDRVAGLRQSLKVRVRQSLERVLWKISHRNATEFLVQSASMATKVHEAAPSSKVRVMPFLDDVGFGRKQIQQPASGIKDLDFVYVATPDPHKNHLRLLRAWEILAEQGLYPSLGLTLDADHPLWREVEAVNRHKGTRIVRLEGSDGSARESFYERASALIFPSLLETLGLPLLEAANRGIPILASELDFVRDSVVPTETFDPLSAISIARAVRRRMGKPEAIRAPLKASEFLNGLRKPHGGFP